MQALADSGPRTAALVQFEHCRRLLDDELGIALEPMTIALYEELKRASPLRQFRLAHCVRACRSRRRG